MENKEKVELKHKKKIGSRNILEKEKWEKGG